MVGVLGLGAVGVRAQVTSTSFKIDSLEAALARQPNGDTTRVKTLVQLSRMVGVGSPAKSVVYAQEALKISEQLAFTKGKAGASLQLGIMAFVRNDLQQATNYCNQSLALWNQLNKPKKIGETQNVLASIYGQQGKYGEAVALFVNCAKIAESLGDRKGQVRALMNIGVTLERMADEKAAIGYFQQSLALVDTVQDLSAYANTLVTLGNAYLTLGTINTAIDTAAQAKAVPLLRQAIRVAHGNSDAQNEGYARLALGRLDAMAGRWADAQNQLVQALALSQKIGDAVLIAQSLTWLGDSHLKQGKTDLALGQYQQALGILVGSRDYTDLEQVYAGLARAYAAKGQYNAAFDNQRLQSLYADSTKSEKFVSEAHNLQIKYETEKKESQNRLQAAQLRTQQQIIRRRNTQLLAGLLVAGLLAGLAYLLYTRRRLRREVEFAQERQQLTQLRAQAVLEAEEGERRRIGSDLHDGVGQLLTVAKLNLHALGEELQLDTLGTQTMLQNALDVVNESFLEVRQISHNLMPNALIKRGLAQAVRDFLSKVSPDDRLKINLEVVGLDSGGRLAPTVENVLFRVIQELVQNIIKHAQASEMTLQLVRGPEELTVLVEDNGVGFDPAALDPETSGIGLKNIESRLAFLGGRAEFDSRPGHGTTVTLEVPVLTI